MSHTSRFFPTFLSTGFSAPARKVQALASHAFALGVLLVALPASAQLSIYTDPTSFLAATGAVQSETFNAYTVDQSADNLNFGAFTGHNNIHVDVPALTYSFDGTTNLRVNTTATWADLLFNSPVVAFGAWFVGLNPTDRPYSTIHVDAAGLAGVGSYSHLGTYLPPTTAGGTSQFIGFTSTQAFNRILFDGALCCSSGFAIDNVVYASALAPAVLTPVPEPETYAMFLAGLGLMGTIARRRRNKASS